jgi:hypothetical protein
VEVEGGVLSLVFIKMAFRTEVAIFIGSSGTLQMKETTLKTKPSSPLRPTDLFI